jgi:hypothetical protein
MYSKRTSGSFRMIHIDLTALSNGISASITRPVRVSLEFFCVVPWQSSAHVSIASKFCGNTMPSGHIEDFARCVEPFRGRR